jgi:Fe2+ or Zn2+ uptake regulation protein
MATVNHRARHLGTEQLTPDLERLCRRLGIKLTRQRRIILSEMEQGANHSTADEVFAEHAGGVAR